MGVAINTAGDRPPPGDTDRGVDAASSPAPGALGGARGGGFLGEDSSGVDWPSSPLPAPLLVPPPRVGTGVITGESTGGVSTEPVGSESAAPVMLMGGTTDGTSGPLTPAIASITARISSMAALTAGNDTIGSMGGRASVDFCTHTHTHILHEKEGQ